MEWKITFPKVSSLAKFASKLIIFLFSTSSRSLLLSFSLPICGRRLFRGFHADSQSIYLSVARGITKRGSLKLVDAVTCEGKRKLTGFDSPAKCCSFFFWFFFDFEVKKKGHKYCCVCVCCLICCVRFYGGWRKNAVPSWHFVSSRRCFGQNRRARIVRQYWFRLFSYFFSPSFCLFLLRVKVWVSSRVKEEATFRRPGWKNCDIRHSK